jgi:type II secretion system protein C
MLRIQRWIAGLEILLGLGVAALAALVVSAATTLWVDDGARPVTTPIPPRAITPTPLPDTAVVLAALGRANAAPAEAGPRAGLHVRGVALRGDDWLAVIADADGTQHLRRVGDVVEGATIVAVTWDGIMLEADGRRTHLPLETQPPADAEAPRPVATPSAPPARDVRQVSADSFLVDRAALLGQVGNMSSLLAQLRAVPEVEAGEPIGFRVFSIAKESIFRRLGLRDGDVIRRVNGTTLHDPTALLSFIQGLGNESRIALDLVRGGKPATLVYDLR